jgi:hypothetical protein
MSWPPGTIVVCIDAANILTIKPLVEGAYYTVRRCGIGRNRHGERGLCVYLNEITNHLGRYGLELAYCATRFRIAETTIREIVMVSQKAPVRT